MQKDQSIVNEDLNNAFVEGELNKTVNGSSEGNNWNLLDDPNLQDEEEGNQISNVLDFSEKEIYNNSDKSLQLSVSYIKPNQNKLDSKLNYGQKKIVQDDEEDIKGLYDEIFKGMKIQQTYK